jgi:hypothetical protein
VTVEKGVRLPRIVENLRGKEAKLFFGLDVSLWLLFCIRGVLRLPFLSWDLRLWGLYVAVIFPALWICLLKEKIAGRCLWLATSAFFTALIPAVRLF